MLSSLILTNASPELIRQCIFAAFTVATLAPIMGAILVAAKISPEYRYARELICLPVAVLARLVSAVRYA